MTNPTYDPRQSGNNFTFTLKEPATTSSGVYSKDGVLLRTLWSNVHFEAGKQVGTWNGNDDLGKPIPLGSFEIRVLSNNAIYVWDGVIGNKSDKFNGDSTIHHLRPIADMTFFGRKGYQAVGYSEGSPSRVLFDPAKPNSKQYIPTVGIESDLVVTDGINVYWSAINTTGKMESNTFVLVTGLTDDAEKVLNGSVRYEKINGQKYNPICFLDQANSYITGMAVQRTGRLLLVARAGINRLDIVNKTIGQTLATLTNLTAPRGLAFDTSNNLWILYKFNGFDTIEKFTLDNGGNLKQIGDSGFRLLNIIQPEAFDISPDGKTILVIDGGAAQQIKAYTVADGNPLWEFGQVGGYASSPDVSFDRFDFDGIYNKMVPFIRFQPDGSFWVGDPGLCRVQHFNAKLDLLDTIMYRPQSYACNVDPGNPTRVFSDYLEYRIDYSKPVAPNNGSWTLVKNYSKSVPISAKNNKYGIKPITFGGRTYTLQYRGSQVQELILCEIPATGHIRNLGIKFLVDDTYWFPAGYIGLIGNMRLHADGCLYSVSRVQIGKPTIWTKNRLIAIDENGIPRWAPVEIIAQTPPVTKNDPVPQGDYMNARAGEITTSGIIVSFAAGIAPYTSELYHLGGIKDNKWIWKTSRSTIPDYTGDFPKDGSYDIGNSVKLPAGVAMAIDNSIFWHYYGEFWKGAETNMFNHFNEDGLMIGQFGVADVNLKGVEGIPGMAGNGFSTNIVKGPDGVTYIYQNDESQHGGIHRWSIRGIDTIAEEIIPFTLPFVGDVSVIDTGEKVIDLLAGLPYSSALPDGKYGWKRTPALNYTKAGNDTIQVLTNKKVFDKNVSPDIYVNFASPQANGANSMTITRDLENDTTLSACILSGGISWPDNNWPNGDVKKLGKDGEGGQFLELLDDQGKIIAQLSTRINVNSSVTDVVGNNQIIATGVRSVMIPMFKNIQPFSISVINGKVSFRYGLNLITTDVLDPKSNWQMPKTLSLYFWIGVKGNPSNRQIDLSKLSFTCVKDLTLNTEK